MLSKETRERFGWLWIMLPAGVSLLTLWHHYHIPGVSADGTIFLQIARNFLFGQGLGWQALWVPPFHSVLLAGAAHLTGGSDLLAAAAIVGSLQAFLLVLVVYGLAATIFDRRTAVIAALVTAVFPHLLFITFSPESEITYTFLLALALFLFALAVKRQSYPFATVAGVAFAMAYLTRSEGFIVMGLVFLATLMVQGWRFYRTTVLKLCAVTAVVFLLASLPYLLFLQKNYGAWVISPKTTYVMIWMKSRIYHDNDKGEMGNEELWGLNSEGKLRWQEPKGIGELADYLMSDPGKSLAVYLRNLSQEIPGRIPNNSGMETYPQVFPIYLALAALLAVFASMGAASRWKLAILLAPFALLFILPVFTEGWWRYLVPYLPLLIILAARGVWVLAEFCSRPLPLERQRMVSTVMAALMAALVMARMGYTIVPNSVPIAVAPELTARRSYAVEQQHAGEWAVQQFGVGGNYMASWSKIIYYLNGTWTAFPVASLEETLAYARKNRADYLVLEMMGETLATPELTKLIPGVTLAGVYRSSGINYAAAFYKITPETRRTLISR